MHVQFAVVIIGKYRFLQFLLPAFYLCRNVVEYCQFHYEKHVGQAGEHQQYVFGDMPYHGQLLKLKIQKRMRHIAIDGDKVGKCQHTSGGTGPGIDWQLAHDGLSVW